MKPGFREFLGTIFERARVVRCKLQLISCGATPIQDFKTAVASHKESWNVLLLDSDAPHDPNRASALCHENGISTEHADSIFWMVEIMESWFLADRDALRQFYGSQLLENALPANPRIEEIAKQKVLSLLEHATKQTGPGAYHKTRHAPRLLQSISSPRVRAAAPNCERMFKTLLGRLEND